MNLKGKLYRIIMKIAHRFNWHYTPPMHLYGDIFLLCKWCGFFGRKIPPKDGDKTINYHAEQCAVIARRLAENSEKIRDGSAFRGNP